MGPCTSPVPLPLLKTRFRHCQGCGLVNFETHEKAAAALKEVHNVYTWPGGHETMILKWGQPPDKRPRRDPFGQGAPQYGPPGSREPPKFPPPPECDADALRLFVGGIPKEATKDECEEFFAKYGKVCGLCDPARRLHVAGCCVALAVGSARQ